MTDSWLPRFEQWAASWRAGARPRLPREQVHKQREHNVFVRRMEPVGPNRPATYAVQLHVPPDHPYFFEHPQDHVPGLALIEAGRQAGLATAHRYYGVPTEGFRFLIHDLHAHFDTFAELDEPVFGCCVITDVRRKRDRLVSMICTGHYLQDGRPIGTLTGQWTVVPESVLARMRRGVPSS